MSTMTPYLCRKAALMGLHIYTHPIQGWILHDEQDDDGGHVSVDVCPDCFLTTVVRTLKRHMMKGSFFVAVYTESEAVEELSDQIEFLEDF